MSKRLLLVRHAKSDWSIAGQKDFDRALNSRGSRVAPKMGAILKDKDYIPEHIVASSALRASATAILMAEQMGYQSDKVAFDTDIYDASTRVLLQVVNQLDDRFNTIMLVGHNPGFTYITEYMTDDTVGDMPTCSVAIVDFELDSWSQVSQGNGSLKWFAYPKMFDL